MGLVDPVPSCHFFSWVFRGSRIFFSWGFCGSKNFYRANFVGPNFFIVRIPWIRAFLSWIFCWFKSFSCEYFVGPVFFLVANFVIQRFSVGNRKQEYINISQTAYFIPNRFQQWLVLFILKVTSSTKLVMLIRSFH